MGDSSVISDEQSSELHRLRIEIASLKEKLTEADVKLKKELLMSESKFSEFADLLPQLIFESDMDGKITCLNTLTHETSHR